jgi:hypothetical protein
MLLNKRWNREYVVNVCVSIKWIEIVSSAHVDYLCDHPQRRSLLVNT